MKKYLIVVETPPSSDIVALDTVDLILAMVALECDLKLVFLGDGIQYLEPNKTAWQKNLQSISSLGFKEIYNNIDKKQLQLFIADANVFIRL